VGGGAAAKDVPEEDGASAPGGHEQAGE